MADHGPAKGITRWLYTTNHKDIGTLYLWFSFIMFLVGGLFAMIIRAELFEPGMQLVQPEFFNQMTTMPWSNHGIWCHYACFCWFGKLVNTNHDWRSRYGVATHE